jgi:hypothetical protein
MGIIPYLIGSAFHDIQHHGDMRQLCRCRYLELAFDQCAAIGHEFKAQTQLIGDFMPGPYG